jgi:hypothetical protein
VNSKNGLLGGIGNLLGQRPTDMWANQTSVAPAVLGGSQISTIGGYQLEELERAMRQKEKSKMIEDGDIIIRKVRNGFRVIAVKTTGGHGMMGQTEDYIATDIDNVHDVIKLASVNGRLDAAK